MILLDTNLLGRMTDRADPQYAAAHRAVRILRTQKDEPLIVPQNLFEFWAVATRAKAQNGLAMTPDRAALWIGYFRRLCSLLPDRPELAMVWLELVKAHAIKGFKAHDARLAAAMLTHKIPRLLTFNGADFKALPIAAVHPDLV